MEKRHIFPIFHKEIAYTSARFLSIRAFVFIIFMKALGVWHMDGKAVKAILGKNVKFLRLRKGLTQAVLAEKANISVIFLSSIERGTKYPKAETVAHLAKVLEVEVFELFIGKEAPTNKVINHLSIDIKKNVITLLDNIFKQYS
jgi:transcriptional regulator with XRE-family HTH domain